MENTNPTTMRPRSSSRTEAAGPWAPSRSHKRVRVHGSESLGPRPGQRQLSCGSTVSLPCWGRLSASWLSPGSSQQQQGHPPCALRPGCLYSVGPLPEPSGKDARVVFTSGLPPRPVLEEQPRCFPGLLEDPRLAHRSVLRCGSLCFPGGRLPRLSSPRGFSSCELLPGVAISVFNFVWTLWPPRLTVTASSWPWEPCGGWQLPWLARRLQSLVSGSIGPPRAP